MKLNWVTDYLSPLFNPTVLRRVVANCSKTVKQLKPDAIVCRGLSGISIAFAVSIATGVPVAVVRKKDGNHSTFDVEGVINFKSYVVIDDLVDSGKTLKKIRQQVKSKEKDSNCIGVLLYNTKASWRPLKQQREIVESIMKAPLLTVSKTK
jgi:adenine/guanine phosphoribosyltransferase-like PRPP-binding protein